MILVDAGPLVALLHADDQHHRACVKASRTLSGPMATVWPAFTEAMYLLDFSFDAQDALWDWAVTGRLRLIPLGAEDAPRMRELMKKYRDLPMDLADAALVRVAERDHLRRIFTVDRSDFERYRLHGKGRFAIVP